MCGNVVHQGLTQPLHKFTRCFTWQTSSSFVGKCYEVLVELDNGMTKAARFKFTK